MTRRDRRELQRAAVTRRRKRRAQDIYGKDVSVRRAKHTLRRETVEELTRETRRRGHVCVTQGGEQVAGRWYHTYLLEVAWTADTLTAHIPFGAAYDTNGYITEPSNVYTLALTNQFHVDLSPFAVRAGSLAQEVRARRGVSGVSPILAPVRVSRTLA